MTLRSRTFRIRESLRTSLWFIPSLFAVGAIVLWATMGWLDDREVVEGLPLGFDGGPAAARGVLSAIATSMIAFTGVVFSVTIVALQLAGSQYSPRVLRNFLQDRRTQVALGSFIATFVYALLVLRGVHEEGPGVSGFVPRVSVSVAFLVLGFSLVMFVVYIHEIAQSIRSSRIVDAIADETRAVLDNITTDDETAPATPEPSGAAYRVVLAADRPGVVQGFDVDRIVSVASRSDTRVMAVVAPGDFVATGMPLITTPDHDSDVDNDGLRGTVAVGRERTMEQDVRFGFRQLVDIALRALSPGVNDPTTAVQCLDQLHDLLRRCAMAPFRSGVHCDEEGIERFSEPVPRWPDLMDLAVTEIRIAGRDQIQVRCRLAAMLDDLASVARPEHLPALARVRDVVGDPVPS